MVVTSPAMPSLLSHPPKLHKQQEEGNTTTSTTTSPKANTNHGTGNTTNSSSSSLVIRRQRPTLHILRSPPTIPSSTTNNNTNNNTTVTAAAASSTTAAASGHFFHRSLTLTTSTATTAATRATVQQLQEVKAVKTVWRTGADIDWSVDRIYLDDDEDVDEVDEQSSLSSSSASLASPIHTTTTSPMDLDDNDIDSSNNIFKNRINPTGKNTNHNHNFGIPSASATGGRNNVAALINNHVPTATATSVHHSSMGIPTPMATPMATAAKTIPTPAGGMVMMKVPSRRSSSASSLTSSSGSGSSSGTAKTGFLSLSPPNSISGLTLASPPTTATRENVGGGLGLKLGLSPPQTQRSVPVTPMATPRSVNTPMKNTNTMMSPPQLKAPRPVPFHNPVHALLAQQQQREQQQ
ncbi:hypothetical protein FRC16_001591, partial [Serendipita sp. 398]